MLVIVDLAHIALQIYLRQAEEEVRQLQFALLLHIGRARERGIAIEAQIQALQGRVLSLQRASDLYQNDIHQNQRYSWTADCAEGVPLGRVRPLPQVCHLCSNGTMATSGQEVCIVPFTHAL